MSVSVLVTSWSTQVQMSPCVVLTQNLIYKGNRCRWRLHLSCYPIKSQATNNPTTKMVNHTSTKERVPAISVILCWRKAEQCEHEIKEWHAETNAKNVENEKEQRKCLLNRGDIVLAQDFAWLSSAVFFATRILQNVIVIFLGFSLLVWWFVSIAHPHLTTVVPPTQK